jgi:starch-binding outer membrane protein, SusD/RagB family
MVNVAAFFQVTYQGTYNSTAPNCVALWKGLYILINDANIGIAGFRQAATNGILAPNVALQYEAECRFLRAMAHHEAVLHWARPFADGNGDKIGIPYRENPINTIDAAAGILNTPRMRVDSVYMKMLEDLDFAEANLNASSGSPLAGGNTFRATKAAAIALKMRIKMHKEDWTGVQQEGAKLVPAQIDPLKPTTVVSPVGGWTLTASPDGPFTNNNSLESIFSIKNDPSDAPSTNGGLASMFGSATLSARGLVIISPVIWNNPGWRCDDKRRSSLTVQGSNNAGNQSIFTTKYRDYTNRGDYAPQIRYAEVLLTLAEAEARIDGGVSARSIDLLNVVRNRSLDTPATKQYTAANFAAKADLIKAILLERRIEFLAEGKRWGDISRLAMDPVFGTGGIPAKAVNGNGGAAGFATYVCGGGYSPGQAAIPYSDYRFVWPIPQSERDANPVIEQNPNY